jgi:hypothetical protein
MTKMQEILSHLPVKFNTPVVLGLLPFWVIRIYGIEKTKAGDVMVQINDGSFHKLEETDKNYDLVADSILKRLDTLQS